MNPPAPALRLCAAALLATLCQILPLPVASADDWLPDLDREMRWNECSLPALPARIIQTPEESLVAEADAVDLRQKTEQVELHGQVVIQQPGLRVYANQLAYDRDDQRLSTSQPFLIELEKMKLLARQGEYFPNRSQGWLEGVEYRLHEPRARGRAERVELQDSDRSRYENPTFTTCPPGNKGFELQADEMEIDRQEKVGHFRNASLRFLGVPIFYAPKLSIPLTDERRSGLLLPSVGYSSKNGFELETPYYLNLAPNYDATITPRILSRRGVLVGGEFRYLQPQHRGELVAEILPNDRLYDGDTPRGAFHAFNRSTFGPGVKLDLDINWVSDDDYLEDLGRSLAVTSTRHLRNRAALSWSKRDWDLLAEVRHYETLDQSIPNSKRPYSLLPRLSFVWNRSSGPAGLEYGFNGELVHFRRKESVQGQRIDLEPRISLPLWRDWGYLRPELSARYTGYSLSDQEPHLDSRPSRATYTASLDTGLFFERQANWLSQGLTHTLEPRAFYVYTPYENQDNIPLFDTGLLDFTFDNLFRGNRFNGPDRVGDANQLALALTSRLIGNDTGRELLRASIGQIFYFDELRVQLDPDDPPFDHGGSSVIAELSTEIFRNWLLRAGVQVDPNQSDRFRQGLAQATWRGERGEIFHVGWRKREELLEQTDLAAIWPVSQKLSLIGRWYYSVQESRTLEAVAGIEYGDCCWRLRTVLRRYLDGPGEEYNTSFLVQLELHGLGSLGNNIDNFLDRTIYGY